MRVLSRRSLRKLRCTRTRFVACTLTIWRGELMRKTSLVLALMLGIDLLSASNGSFTAGVASAASTNLMLNGSFEETTSTVSGAWKGIADPIPVHWDLWIPTGSGKEPNKTATVKIDTEHSHEGKQSLLFDAFNTSRVSVKQVVTSLTAGKSYKLKLWLKTDNVSGQGVYFRTQYYNTAKVGDGPASEKWTGTRDWTMQQVVLTIPETTTKLTIEPFLETGKGKVWFDDLVLEEYSGYTGITLDQTAFSLAVGSKVRLSPTMTPSTASDKSVIWTSSNPDVAIVNDLGEITSVGIGTTTIRISTPDGLTSAECLVNVESASDMEAYESLREKWHTRLTGGAFDESDPDIVAAVTAQANKASGFWKSLDKSPGRTWLWSDLTSTTDSSQITTAYNRLKTMALAYSVPGSDLFENKELANDIVSALDWMYANRYNGSKKAYNNWWDWEIGAPQVLNDVMVLMYDHLSREQITRFISAIDTFCPNPKVGSVLGVSGVKMTGANLLDKAFVVTLRGIIEKNSAKIMLGRDSIGSEYVYATKGDGVYRDGSLVQHSNIAYTGGYGSVWLKGTADMSYLLTDSPWPITDRNVLNVYDWVSQTYEPIIYNGQFMDMVNGRGISRSGSGSARSTIITLLRMAESAPDDVAISIKQMAKEWISKDTTYSNYYEGLSLGDIMVIKKLMNEDAITPRSHLVKNQVFAGMDRVVHLRDGFGFGLSLFSDRISAFEKGNNENLKGWYTGIGMTYLYDRDFGQYRNDFWPTVDSFRLPGTTTDGSGQGRVPGEWTSYMNTQSWVGGVSLDGEYGAAGMDFSLAKVTGSDLKGKKSWFMFDDEIVALGSGITSNGSGPQTVETLIENRMLNAAGDNRLIMDGVDQPLATGSPYKTSGVHWAHLDSNTDGSGTGYYFPDAAELSVLRESRTASWKEINSSQASTPITRNYLSLAFDHGETPANASYSYVLLPEQGGEATKQYSENPDIDVLANTIDIHAVKEKTLGLTAANFWNPGTVGDLRSEQPASVIMKETDDGLSIAVSDPTQQQSEITLYLNRAGLVLASADPTVTIEQTAPYIKLRLNTNGSLGAAHTVVFKKEVPVSSLHSTLQTETSVDLEWTVPDGVSGIEGYEITKDGITVSDATYRTVTSDTYTATVDGLLPGTIYHFAVSGLDGGGQRVGDSREITVATRDDTPPSAPVLSYTSVTDTSIALKWSESSDNVGVSGYSLYRDGQWVTSVSASVYSQTLDGLIPATEYVFSVKASDAASNLSESNKLRVTTDPSSTEGGTDNGSGNGDGSEGGSHDNPSGNEGTQGNSDVSTETSDHEATHGVKIVNEKMLRAPVDGVVSISLTEEETKISLPQQAGALLGKSKLEIKKKGVTLTIDSALLSAIEADSVGHTAVLLTFEPVGEQEASVLVGGSRGSNLHLGSGGMMKFGVFLVGADVEKEYNQPFAVPVRIRFDASAYAGLDPELLGIYVYDQDVQTLKYVSGLTGNHKESIEAYINSPGLYTVLEYNKGFNDLPASHWAQRAVKVLTARHIVNGRTETEFAPDLAVTRAEFISLIVRTWGFAVSDKNAFDDVKPQAWYADAVAAAYEAGLVKGKADGIFDPNGPISREDMAVMAARLSTIIKGSMEGQVKEIKFIDADQVSAYAREDLKLVVNLGLMEGRGEAFHPQGQTTRAEATQVMVNMIDFLGMANPLIEGR